MEEKNKLSMDYEVVFQYNSDDAKKCEAKIKRIMNNHKGQLLNSYDDYDYGVKDVTFSCEGTPEVIKSVFDNVKKELSSVDVKVTCEAFILLSSLTFDVANEDVAENTIEKLNSNKSLLGARKVHLAEYDTPGKKTIQIDFNYNKEKTSFEAEIELLKTLVKEFNAENFNTEIKNKKSFLESNNYSINLGSSKTVFR
jgi:hypothetical protein